MRALQKLMQPSAANDFNAFLEKLPVLVGNQVLMAGGIAWAAAAALGLYTFIDTKKLIDMRAELKNTEALKPMVPKITDIPV